MAFAGFALYLLYDIDSFTALWKPLRWGFAVGTLLIAAATVMQLHTDTGPFLVDHLDELINLDIPVVMVYGDSDNVVPYHENGAVLEKYYRENGGIIEAIGKENCGHHPHGLDDNTPIIEFVEKYSL